MWHVDHDGTWLDDAPGIFAAFTRRVGPAGIDLRWFAEMSAADGADLFAGRGTLLLIDERVAVLRETASILVDRWDGSARHLVEEANRDGGHIVRLLSDLDGHAYQAPELSRSTDYIVGEIRACGLIIRKKDMGSIHELVKQCATELDRGRIAFGSLIRKLENSISTVDQELDALDVQRWKLLLSLHPPLPNVTSPGDVTLEAASCTTTRL